MNSETALCQELFHGCFGLCGAVGISEEEVTAVWLRQEDDVSAKLFLFGGEVFSFFKAAI